MSKAGDAILKYQRPTRVEVDLAGQSYVYPMLAEGLIERAARFVRTLGSASPAAELRKRVERFEATVKPDSELDRLRQAAHERVAAQFTGRAWARTGVGGLVWKTLPARRSPDGTMILRAGQQVIPNAHAVQKCVETIDEVCWNLPNIVPVLDEFLDLELDPPFAGIDDMRGFRDAVWTVWVAEKEDHVWGCFLLAQCETAFGSGRKHYQQLLARLDRAQEQALKDAVEFLDGTKRRRRTRSRSAAARQSHKAAARSNRETPEHLTPAQLAKRWGVDRDKILGWIRSGELSAIDTVAKQGGRPRYRVAVEAVLAFEQRRSVQPPPRRSRQKKSSKQDGIIQFY